MTVFTCCSDLLIQNSSIKTMMKLWLWEHRKIYRKMHLTWLEYHSRLYKCFLGLSTLRLPVHACVWERGGTITKMHSLKLDPYRYQTESWSRQADATRQCERNTHRQTRTCTHHSRVLINARGRRKVITFVCISGSYYWSDSKVKSLGMRLPLLYLTTTTL